MKYYIYFFLLTNSPIKNKLIFSPDFKYMGSLLKGLKFSHGLEIFFYQILKLFYFLNYITIF
jgi:hypothetical protein